MLQALEETLHPPQILILRGTNQTNARMAEGARDGVRASPARHRHPVGREGSSRPHSPTRSPLGDIVAYVCQGSVCSAPISEFSVLVEQLRSH